MKSQLLEYQKLSIIRIALDGVMRLRYKQCCVVQIGWFYLVSVIYRKQSSPLLIIQKFII